MTSTTLTSKVKINLNPRNAYSVMSNEELLETIASGTLTSFEAYLAAEELELRYPTPEHLLQ